MEVHGISKEKFFHKLEASGKANRWNEEGQLVIYAGSSRSLATLELVVHKDAVHASEDYKVMVISIADDDYLFKQVLISELPKKEAYYELSFTR